MPPILPGPTRAARHDYWHPSGREGDIFRKVIGWSILLVLIMAVLVLLQSTSALSWMVP